MATTAAIGITTTCQLDNVGGTLTSLSQVTSINGWSLQRDTIDATHMGSPSNYREKIGGLLNAGEATVEMDLDGFSASDQLIREAMTATSTRTFKLVLPDLSTFACECWVTGYSGVIPVDDKMTATMTVEFTGVPTFAAS